MNCIFCGKKLDGSLEHIIPFALGGNETSKNLICTETNSKLGERVDSVSNELKEFLGLSGYTFPVRKHKNNRGKKRVELEQTITLGNNQIPLSFFLDIDNRKIQLAHPTVGKNYIISDSKMCLNKLRKNDSKEKVETIELAPSYSWSGRINLIKLMMEALKIHCELAIKDKRVSIDELRGPLKLIEDYLESDGGDAKNWFEKLLQYTNLHPQGNKICFSRNSVQVFTYYMNGCYASVISFFGVFVLDVNSPKNYQGGDRNLDYATSKKLPTSIG